MPLTTERRPPARLYHRVMAWLPWALFVLVAGGRLFDSARAIADAGSSVALANHLASNAFSIMFAFVGALIISRQPRNLIGWLLVVPSFSDLLNEFAVSYLQQAANASSPPTFAILAMVWYLNWDWWRLIGPTLLIFLLFPAGRLLSPRWRWVVVALALSFAYFVTGLALQIRLTVPDTDLSWPNPIGVISETSSDALPPVLLPFFLGLIASAVLSVAALVVRYRRAGAVERAQIKWLLYPGAVLASLYILTLVSPQFREAWFGVLFSLALLGIPAAIAIAVLRYRLWDIDLIIRRTLIYSALTALLAVTYFGGVLVLQSMFYALTGQEQNTLAGVLSTLAIAALFVPLRSRLQRGIDRRFFRSKYDAARTLGGFAASARDETDLERLSDHLVSVVADTMQPEIVSLWLRPAPPATANFPAAYTGD